MAEKQLDGGESESTISCLKADCPLEDGQMGNSGLYRYRWHGRNLSIAYRAQQVACFGEVVRRHHWRKEHGISYGPPNLGEIEMVLPGAQPAVTD
jgi:hypothetical protein